MNPQPGETPPEISQIFRKYGGRVLASLISAYGDFDLAEDALQDAALAALERWPKSGLPPNPAGWLTLTAKRKAIDTLRRRKNLASKLPALLDQENEATAMDETLEEAAYPDERLKLIFTVCHPAISQESQIALTLKTLGGLSNDEIARSFLIAPQTVAQRIVRAKRKLRGAGIPYRVPPIHLLSDRVEAVLLVIYLIFNQGYYASGGDTLLRKELSDEALRLGEMLVSLLILAGYDVFVPEARGLLALMLIQDSRAAARLGAEGELVTLEEQDRSRWDREKIEAGLHQLEMALDSGQVGIYQLQAAISAQHARAESPAETDWERIAAYYGLLEEIHPTPIVSLNRAVAVGMAYGPEKGLALVENLAQDDQLSGYVPFHAARADFNRRLGRSQAAAAAYREARALAGSKAERKYFERRLGELS